MAKTAISEIVFTIGHSTRSIDEFLELLRAHDIRTLIDVRRFPGSRRHPQFGREALHASLTQAGLRYVHQPDLGGRREPETNSPNTAWRVAAFRGYADYARGPQFGIALDALIEAASSSRTVIMCAEALPWRCHRRLIADYLVARGMKVQHILGPAQLHEHILNPSARIQRNGTLVYAGSAADQPDLWR